MIMTSLIVSINTTTLINYLTTDWHTVNTTACSTCTCISQVDVVFEIIEHSQRAHRRWERNTYNNVIMMDYVIHVQCRYTAVII